MSTPKTLQELVAKWEQHAKIVKDTEQEDVFLGCAADLKDFLTAQRSSDAPVQPGLYPEQLIAVSFDPTQDASLPPKGRWVYLSDALRAVEKDRERRSVELSETRKRVAEALDWCVLSTEKQKEQR